MNQILITGANRGIGLELTRQCAARGDRVFAGCRSPQKAAALEMIRAAYPQQVIVLPLDVTDPQSLQNSHSLVAAETTALDILFNNAAIHLGDENLLGVKSETLLQTLHVNAVGTVLVAQQFIALLKKGKKPRLVNISSEAGSISRMTHFRGYSYYGSKAALNMYTRGLAFDPESAGVIVIALHPGWVRTDMGGEVAHLSVTESVAGLLKVTAGLTPKDNGKFYTWEGREYPW